MREVPHSSEFEMAAIGAVLMEPDSMHAATQLADDEFYRPIHKTIWRNILSVHSRHDVVDVFSVVGELRRNGQYEEVGEMAYLTACIEACPSALDIGRYVNELKEKSALRKVLYASEKIADTVYKQEHNSSEVIQIAEQEIFKCNTTLKTEAVFQVSELVPQTMKTAYEVSQNPDLLKGRMTGFRDYDLMTDGLHDGDLTILAARPSMGKTALMMAKAVNVSKVSGPVIVFSAEMSKEALMNRAIASESRINSKLFRKGQLTDEEWERASNAAKRIAALPLFIIDTPGIGILEVRSHVRRIASRHGKPALLLLDYLQRIRPSQREERRLEIATITKECKNIAREFCCPFVVLSQLSRKVEQREDKRPMLSDLYESGEIEAEADVVAFLYRKAYYEREKKEESWGPKETEVAELIIGKQRNGPTGTVELAWLSEYARFENLQRES